MMEKRSDDPVIIMRYPVTMEDEGRHFFVMHALRDYAEQWIANQKDEYYRPSDYYIAEKQK